MPYILSQSILIEELAPPCWPLILFEFVVLKAVLKVKLALKYDFFLYHFARQAFFDTFLFARQAFWGTFSAHQPCTKLFGAGLT